MQPSTADTRPGIIHAITREIALASPSEVLGYLAGSSRDATWNKKHRTTRWAQSDRRWLEIIQQLLSRIGSKAWIYREGTRQVWVQRRLIA
jgi:hypothetical protein